MYVYHYASNEFPQHMFLCRKKIYMGLNTRKPVFRGLWTTKAQTSLRIRADWSAPLLLTFWKVSYLNLPYVKFHFLASLFSWGDWFESCFVGNPEDKFCRVAAKHVSVRIPLLRIPVFLIGCSNLQRGVWFVNFTWLFIDFSENSPWK